MTLQIDSTASLKTRRAFRRKEGYKWLGLNEETGRYERYDENGILRGYPAHNKTCPICNLKFTTQHKDARTCSLICSHKLRYQEWVKDFEQNKINATLPSNPLIIQNRVKRYFQEKYHHELFVEKITPCCGLDITSMRNQGLNETNGKLCIMQVDHHDNDPSNSYYSNLKYLCVVCHVVKTDTNAGRGNRQGNGRNSKYKKLAKNFRKQRHSRRNPVTMNYRNELIKSMHDNGDSTKEIAERFKLKRRTINTILRKFKTNSA